MRNHLRMISSRSGISVIMKIRSFWNGSFRCFIGILGDEDIKTAVTKKSLSIDLGILLNRLLMLLPPIYTYTFFQISCDDIRSHLRLVHRFLFRKSEQ